MKCQSCKEDIPPKFAHALSVNICPMCGQEVMDIRLKNILSALKIALEDAKNHMEDVEDWLFSNFSLKKIKLNEMIVDKNANDKITESFYGKGSQPVFEKQTQHKPGVMVNRSDNDDGEDVVVDDSASTIFAKRAGVIHPKKALDFIKGKSDGAAPPSEFKGVDEEYGDVFANDTNAKPLNTNEIHQMNDLFGVPNLAKTSHELEMQKLKRLQAQSSISNGSGSIRRSE